MKSDCHENKHCIWGSAPWWIANVISTNINSTKKGEEERCISHLLESLERLNNKKT
jgi:hypothetical protein